jgi:hypothetical protein
VFLSAAFLSILFFFSVFLFVVFSFFKGFTMSLFLCGYWYYCSWSMPTCSSTCSLGWTFS